MNIGIAGTGKMGLAIGQRLLGLGHTLHVWNRNPARAQPLVDAGARLAAHPADLSAQCDVVLSLLTDANAVEQVYTAPHGLLSKPHAVLIEMSTVPPKVPIAEGTIQNPINPYGRTKLMGEMVLVRNQVLQFASKSEDLEFLSMSKRLNVVTSEIHSVRSAG